MECGSGTPSLEYDRQAVADSAIIPPAEERAVWDKNMKLITRLEEIPSKGLKFTYEDGPFEEEGFVLRIGSDEVRAFKNECRHLPMPLDDRDPSELWDPAGRYLVCNSHGARYRPEDGLCVAGPCEGSHLKALPVHVSDGEVFLDTSKLGSFFDV